MTFRVIRKIILGVPPSAQEDGGGQSERGWKTLYASQLKLFMLDNAVGSRPSHDKMREVEAQWTR